MWWHLLPSPIVLNVSGKDSQRYINNRLTHNFKSAEVGSVLPAAALNPQGRIQAFFWVVVAAPDRFLLVCDGGIRVEVVAAFKKYLVADRVSVEDLSDSHGVILVDPKLFESIVQQSLAALAPSAGIYRRNLGKGEYSVDIVAPRAEIEALNNALVSNPAAQRLDSPQYDLLRMQNGWPAFPHELNEDVILTEVGIREAVSFTKGCYVGQEVIEKIDAVGRVPRTLMRVQFAGKGEELTSQTLPLMASGVQVGKLVSWAYDGEGARMIGFALVKTGAIRVGDPVTCGSLQGTVV